jgi:hypothetical protein
MRLSIVVALVGITAVACPHPESRTDCVPGTFRCQQLQPYVCSPGQYWTPASSRCQGAQVCCMTRNPSSGRSVFACVPSEACVESHADAGEVE